MRLLKNWDKEEKASAIRILGLITGALTIFILMACVSYLFRWKQDMSLLGDTEAMQAARKAAGSLGIRTGHLLISELFGLGSFCLLLILVGHINPGWLIGGGLLFGVIYCMLICRKMPPGSELGEGTAK